MYKEEYICGMCEQCGREYISTFLNRIDTEFETFWICDFCKKDKQLTEGEHED